MPHKSLSAGTRPPRAMSGATASRGHVRARTEAAAADEAPEHLLCCVCLDVPCGLIEQCCNGHLICAEVEPTDEAAAGGAGGAGGAAACAAQIRAMRGPKCPLCRVALGDTPIRALSAMQSVATLRAVCRHRGCSHGTTRGELRLHEGACPRAPARCVANADGCRWEGLAAEREAHEATCMCGEGGAKGRYGASGKYKTTNHISVEKT